MTWRLGLGSQIWSSAFTTTLHAATSGWVCSRRPWNTWSWRQISLRTRSSTSKCKRSISSSKGKCSLVQRSLPISRRQSYLSMQRRSLRRPLSLKMTSVSPALSTAINEAKLVLSSPWGSRVVDCYQRSLPSWNPRQHGTRCKGNTRLTATKRMTAHN